MKSKKSCTTTTLSDPQNFQRETPALQEDKAKEYFEKLNSLN